MRSAALALAGLLASALIVGCGPTRCDCSADRCPGSTCDVPGGMCH